MAIYCPMYDPVYGWYILVCGPNGTQKQMITSPLYYYHSMGVKPPVGSKFSEQDYLNFELDMIDAPTPLPMSSLSPSMGVLAIPVSTSSQAAASAASGFDDIYDLQEPHVLTPVGPASVQAPHYSLPTALPLPHSKITAIMKSSVSNLVSLSQYVDSIHGFPNQFGPPSPMPPGPLGPQPPSKSGVIIGYSPLSLASSMSNILPLQIPKGTKSKYGSLQPFPSSMLCPHHSPMSSGAKHKYSSQPPSFSSMLYSPQSSMSSGSKYKYNNLKPSSLSPMSCIPPLSSGSTYSHGSLQPSSFSSISHASPLAVSNSTKFKHNNLQSSKSSKSAYYMHSLPPPSSVNSKAKQAPIGTPNPQVPSAPANTPKVDKNPVSLGLFDDPSMTEEMYVDSIEETAQDAEDYDMLEY